MAKRRKAAPQPPVELQIDMDDDRVIEAVAQFLLDIARHRHERPPACVESVRQPVTRKAIRKRPRH